MKVVFKPDQIRLIPGTVEELQAIHDAQYRRIKFTQLEGRLPLAAEWVINLGPDYIGDARARSDSATPDTPSCP